MNKLTNKCVAAIASLAMAGTLCVAGAVTMAGVAWGVPPIHQGPVTAKAPWDAKNTTTTGSITIVNCDAKEVKDSEGTSKCDKGHAPLNGAKFTLTQIKKIGDTDITVTDAFKNADTWSKIATTIDALNRGKEKEAKIELDMTQANIKTADVTNGEAKFDNIPLGFYKVEETKMPTTGNYGANDMTVFYMTLPMLKPTKSADGNSYSTTYEYNPVVKIKNKDLSSSITKVFSTGKGSNAVSVNDDFKYEISSEVNHPTGKLDADSIQDYMVFDDAPTEAFNNITDDAVESVKVDGVNDPLEKGADKDYTVSVTSNTTQNKKTENGDDKGLEAGRTRILVKFTKDGLGKIAGALNAAKKAQQKDEPKVHVTVSFKLSDSYKGATDNKNEIKNKSGFFKSHDANASKDPDPVISGEEDKGGTSDVKLGFLQVYKHDKKNTDTKLQGAVFKIFNSEEKAEACKTALLKRAANDTAVPDVCTTGASANFTGTTNSEGKFDADQKVIAGKMVYLIEVTAPTGYALANEIRGVTVEEGKTTTVDFPNTKISDLDIDSWFNLPATGAAGVIIFAVAGMGLIAASVFLYMRNRKEEEQQQNA
ncbi:SpaH/EbpB family LPXTG-anchored major pilin [Gardnerella sp. Marseille-QA0894]|uniref:SpaH/EbpB family LPXTG-anchored major pilin n=1 Tax=Gardnerella sp. Marseille-QA0894 TaxID=3383031 RepID=UPI003AF922CF